LLKNNWKSSINKQRKFLKDSLSTPLHDIAEKCASIDFQRDTINHILTQSFITVPHCTYLYLTDVKGIQLSDNISKKGLLPQHFSRDRSERPYMKEQVPLEGFLLSDAYISKNSNRPSITALHVIKKNNEVVAFLGADFDLRDIPVMTKLYQESDSWRQIKGDPSIRSLVFQQSRVESVLDKNIDQFFSILEELLTQRGMFQGVFHFSSSRATVWVMDDPYRYRILDQEALLDTDICMAYPSRPYPDDALIPKEMIEPIFKTMKELRIADDTIYLRSSSINIFNGLISLTFSCDGSHYMPYHEFLEKNTTFWGGDN
jgi:hypothetical protein